MADNTQSGNGQTREQLLAQIAQLKSELAANPAERSIGVYTSPHGTGALCITGLNRMPMSVYPSQWYKLVSPETIALVDKHIQAGLADGTLSLERVAKGSLKLPVDAAGRLAKQAERRAAEALALANTAAKATA
jgi:hypothetical protein